MPRLHQFGAQLSFDNCRVASHRANAGAHGFGERAEQQAERAEAAAEADHGQPPPRPRVEQDRNGRSEHICTHELAVAVGEAEAAWPDPLTDEPGRDGSDEREQGASGSDSGNSVLLVVVEEETVRGREPPDDGLDCATAPESVQRPSSAAGRLEVGKEKKKEGAGAAQLANAPARKR